MTERLDSVRPFVGVSAQALATIVDDVTTSLLGRATFVDEGDLVLGYEPSSDTGVRATVGVGSPVRLLVSLSCHRDLAFDAAARMLILDTPSEVDAWDVLGELTSVVAGNVKALVPLLSGAPLGSPTIAEGAWVSDPGTVQIVKLRVGNQAFSVSLALSPPDVERSSVAP